MMQTTPDKPKKRANSANVSRREAGPYSTIARLAARPEGCTFAELVQERGSRSGVSPMISRMCQAGELHKERGVIAGKRYFASQALRDAYVRPPAPLPEPKIEAPKARKFSASTPKQTAPKYIDILAPGQIGAVFRQRRPVVPLSDAEPVTPENVRRIVCKSAQVDERYQVVPGTPVPRVIDPKECSPWARIVAP